MKKVFVIFILLLCVASYASQGFLEIAKVYNYSCMTKLEPGYYTLSKRETFVFEETNMPAPLADSSEIKFCHDIYEFGVKDSINFPRLEIKEATKVFSKSDVRFFDINQNGKLDINDYIERELSSKYGTELKVNLFHELRFKFHPNIRVNKTLGFAMDYMLDDANKAICPGEREYNSDSPLYKVLRDVVGNETEAIYVAKEQGNKNNDLILIEESLLRKIKIRSRNADFYWPANLEEPYKYHEGQKEYKLTSITELGFQDIYHGANLGPSHDKRFGCVPKISN